MNIRPIHNESAYKAALKEISILVDLDPEVGTQDVENRLKLTQSFHLKLTHPVTA
jgi:antitoxin component HigA of HigAB toxin-antitoxin module